MKKPGPLSRELAGAALGDPRRSRRLVQVAGEMAQAPQRSICGACGGWNETVAACRLLAAPQVTPEKILAPHRRALRERAAGERCVAVIQDTTELDFTAMRHMQGTGALNDDSRRGLYLHSLYAVSEKGLPLGIWDMNFLARKEKSARAAAGSRKQRPLEQKESHRWLEGYQKTQALAAALPGCEVISLADREGDLYAVFAAWAEQCARGGPVAQWLIRAQQDRALEGLEEGSPDKLFAALASAPRLGEIHFAMPGAVQMKKAKSGSRVHTERSARTVIQEVRALPVTPRAPYRKGGPLPTVTVWALWASEINPPEGEAPIRWLLLTSVPVTTFAQAQRLLALYLRRWDIEVLHRVLKTGCRVESIQLKSAGAVRNALTLYAIIAWRLLYLTHVGRVSPQAPCSLVFSVAEWKAASAVARAKRQEPPLRDPPEPRSENLYSWWRASAVIWAARVTARPARRRSGRDSRACATSPAPGTQSTALENSEKLLRQPSCPIRRPPPCAEGPRPSPCQSRPPPA